MPLELAQVPTDDLIEAIQKRYPTLVVAGSKALSSNNLALIRFPTKWGLVCKTVEGPQANNNVW